MFETVFETQRLAPVSSTEFFRAADAFYERRREGTISFHPKSIRDLRSGVEKQHSGGEVQRSTFAGFSGSLDFRLLQQYPAESGSWGCLPVNFIVWLPCLPCPVPA